MILDMDLKKIQIKIGGMTCASCVANIENSVHKMRGVQKILVSLMGEKAEVLFDPNMITPEQI